MASSGWFRSVAFLALFGVLGSTSVLVDPSPAVAVEPPAAPSGVVAGATGSTVTVSWVDNSSDETGFELLRARNVVGTWGEWASLTAAQNATSMTDSGLADGEYAYLVRAVGTAGASAWASTTVVTISTAAAPPDAPTGFGVVQAGSDVHLSWIDASSDEVAFDVQRARFVAGVWSEWTGYSVDRDVVATTDHPPADGQYAYLLRSRNALGASAWAIEVITVSTAIAPPSAPTSLIAHASPGVVALSWIDTSDNELGFDVLRARNVAGVWGEWTNFLADTDATAYADNGVSAGLYAYLVRSRNTLGASEWAITVVTVTTGANPPAAPSSFQVTPDGANVSLTWVDESNDESDFDIQRARYANGVWSEWWSMPVDRDQTSAVDHAVPDGQYAYLLRSRNANGASPWNVVVTVVSSATLPPPAPTQLIATVNSAGTAVTLGWADQSEGPTGELRFDVQRARRSVDNYTEWTSFAADRNAISFEDTTVGAGTYAYLVRAHNLVGDSDWVVVEISVTGPAIDADSDGSPAGSGLGFDCDDENPMHHPGATEVPLNEADDDCAGGDSTEPRVVSGAMGGCEIGPSRQWVCTAKDRATITWGSGLTQISWDPSTTDVNSAFEGCVYWGNTNTRRCTGPGSMTAWARDGEGGPAGSVATYEGFVVPGGFHSCEAPGTTAGQCTRRVFRILAPGGSLADGPVTAEEEPNGANPSTARSHECSATNRTDYPVNCRTGDFWHTFTDAGAVCRGPDLQLLRTYNSVLAETAGVFGPGWSSNYDMTLSIDPNTGHFVVRQENGSTVEFRSDPPYLPVATRYDARLSEGASPGTFVFTRTATDRFTFDDQGRLQSITDRNGHSISIARNVAGHLDAVICSDGTALDLTTDATGRVTELIGPAGQHVAYVYSPAGDLASAADSVGAVTAFTYDAAHNLVTMTMPDGGVVTNTYDAQHRVTSQTDPTGAVTSFAYDAGGTTITDPLGVVERQAYDSDGQLVSSTNAVGTPLESTRTFTYDQITGQIASITDANGHTTTYTSDSVGEILTVTDPLGRVSRTSYDERRNVTSTTDPTGAVTTWTYDAAGNLLSTTDATGATWTVAYGGQPGEPSVVTAPNGTTTQFTYDIRGNVVSTTDALGHTVTVAYDAAGRPTQTTWPSGTSQHVVYDAAGRPTSVTDRLGNVSSAAHDANGRVILSTDATGTASHFTYDLAGRRTAETRADGSVVHQAFDAAGRLVSYTDAMGAVTAYGYDALGRVVTVTDPLGRSIHLGYDAVGNQTTRTDSLGRVTAYGYDAADQLTSVNYSDGTTPNVSVAYDAAGRTTGMTDGSGASTFAYDSVGRLIAGTDGSGAALHYGYDSVGNQTSLTYPDGSVLHREFDAVGRAISITDPLGGVSAFTYDADGNLTGQTNANGTAANYGVDAAGRLVSAVTTHGATGLTTNSYLRDPLGRVVDELTAGAISDHRMYTYDSVGRLTADGHGLVFTYDPADNLTTKPGGAAQHFDAANQLIDPGFTYDANGNRIGGPIPSGAAQFAYDQENRLVTVTQSSSVIASYGYAADGLRVQRTTGGVTHHYVWDRSTSVPLLLADVTPAGTTKFVHDPAGSPLEEIAPSGTTFTYHHDQLGSTRLLTDAQGASVSTATYDPYGAVSASTGPEPTFGFAGEQRDPETGFVYLRHRYLDPATGQFISVDPLFGHTRSAFAYADNDPMSHIDPEGLEASGSKSFCAGASLYVFGGIGVTLCKSGAGWTVTPEFGVGVGASLMLGITDAPHPGEESISVSARASFAYLVDASTEWKLANRDNTTFDPNCFYDEKSMKLGIAGIAFGPTSSRPYGSLSVNSAAVLSSGINGLIRPAPVGRVGTSMKLAYRSTFALR